jgi:hypothetical protein
MKAPRSSSSKASKSNNLEFEGIEEPWICFDTTLRWIVNPKVPAAYRAAARLEFEGEHLSLVSDDGQKSFIPRRDYDRQAVVSSMVREGRVLAESDPMYWVPVDRISLSRTVRLLHCDLSQVKVSLRFQLQNQHERADACPTLQWQLTLPRCVAFAYDPRVGAAKECPPGDLDRPTRQHWKLVFSFDSKRLDNPNNRLLTLDFGGITPHKVSLHRDEAGRQTVTALLTTDLPPLASKFFTVDLNYDVLLRHRVSDTVFLVARPDASNSPWQGALAASMTWIDRLEACRVDALSGPGFRRFAPFLWFDRNKPLPAQVLRFLHDVPSLKRIIAFGEVLRHDLENLLTALLDKGADQDLRLQIFTGDNSYRDQVNVLRGNIQARMIIADELPDRVRRLEEIVSVKVVSDPNLLPLDLRRLMEEVSISDAYGVTGAVHDSAAFLVSADLDESRFLAAAAVPMARHLAAPVLLWTHATERETLDHLKQQHVRRIFLVGRFSDAEERSICATLYPDDATINTVASPTVRIPYTAPVRAAAALARLFKAHLLLDWLIQALRAEREGLVDTSTPVADLTRTYIDSIRQRSWAARLVTLLDQLVKTGDPGGLPSVYQDTFIGRDEFVTSFQEHFIQAAEKAALAKDEELLAVLDPIWNDMVVLSDFEPRDWRHLDFFPAACFAAYHEAPLLLFPAVSSEEENFLDRRVLELERQFHLMSTGARPAPTVSEAYQEQAQYNRHDLASQLGMVNVLGQDHDLARLIFPSDVQMALRSLKPLNIALYSTDVKVPYEVVSDRNGPVFLNHVIGHLSGTDPYETSLVTASGMLYANELQQQPRWRVLICLADIPSAPLRMLGQEAEEIEKALQNSRFDPIEVLQKEEEVSKARVLKDLGENVHIFHFSGHGIENPKQPQRSGIVFWDAQNRVVSPLNALEVKYRTKLGAHPIVFLNGCFGSSKSRIPLAEKDDVTPQPGGETKYHALSMTAEYSERVMGIASSFVHIGAAAVMAPRWLIFEDTAVMYARHWYKYLAQGCSIGEAALLAKIDSLREMQGSSGDRQKARPDYNVLSYVIWGDPTLRLFTVRHLVKHHPHTVSQLLQFKRISA